MSEQNLLVSAFQAEFLLKILTGLHILKVQNTKHMGSDSISKVWNSNSKRTEILNFISRQTTVQNLETDWYFEGPDVPFRRLDSIRR
ncbi:hypothetical protein RclHR1_19520002 [Rhizophagus clarus]|uniref:Uncharacterized protein n=1 Tax=Rhizophagus clarus TaxID=94130 RepID=A0A2Z6QNW5_9GLOM|nr:hypothetical protein RclHR1_19520002 [Rhizophagus clarus]